MNTFEVLLLLGGSAVVVSATAVLVRARFIAQRSQVP